MYNANFKAEQVDLTKIKFTDLSTGNETPTSRTINIFKTNLVPDEVTFEVGENELIVDGYTKDHAISAVYLATVAVPDADSTYEKTLEFAMLGFSQKAFTDRQLALEVDESIIDKRKFMEDTMEVEYYISNANTFAVLGDLVNAQKSLNYIKDLTGY